MPLTLAEIEAEVGTILGGGITAESAEVLRRKVIEVCAEGGSGDPLSSDPAVRDVGKNWGIVAVSNLMTRRWYLPAKALLYELWDEYAERQRAKKQRVCRALISQLLTEVCHAAGDRGEAYRWALLTQADDILGAHGAGGGHGRHWLYGIFGIGTEERTLIDTTADACRAEAITNGWNTASGFVEEVLRRCVKSGGVGRAMLQRHASNEEFHLTPAYLGVLLDAVEAAQTTDEKGKTLEDCAFYLFGLPPGCVPRSNLLDVAGASEYDVVVNNMTPAGSLVESLFGREFLVECKNWAKPVRVQEVGYFLFRMGLTHCRFGVIFARSGITEAADGEAFARNLVRRAFHEHGSLCVVLDLKDLRALAAAQGHSVMGMLIERVNEFRFGR